MNTSTYSLAQQLGQLMKPRGHTLTTAESCTGGGLAEAITAIPGASAWFGYGFVTYADHAKQQLLNVDADTLARHGAVSEAVAAQMAIGARRAASADFAIATTGIAGPDGGTADKPVGTVWFAWAIREGCVCERRLFSGSREEVRRQAVDFALARFIETIKKAV